MRSRGRIRFFLSLFYLGGLFLAAGYVYQRLQWFEGQIVVEKGKTEHVAVRESRTEAGFSAEERNFPLELIAFDNPSAARPCFDEKSVYDAVALPFHLRLDDVVVLEERPAKEVLEVMQAGRKTEYPVASGTQFPLGKDSGILLGIQRWTGLVGHPSGQPMASVSWHRPGEDWGEPLFLARGAWRMTAAAMALYMDWFENEALAREALPKALPGLQSARWGVVEGRNTHWFNTFSPGAGMTLTDGTEVALVRYDERHAAPEGEKPALLLAIKKDGRVEEGWVYANDSSRDGSIRFDYPGRCETVLIVHGWQEGMVWASAFFQGRLCATVKMSEGRPWTPPSGFPYELRLNQALRQALPAGDDTTPVHALSLQLPTGIIHLREGGTHVFQAFRLHYRKQPQAPGVRYVMSVMESGKSHSYTLSPGGSFRHGFWRFRHVPDNPRAVEVARLTAERTLGGFPQALGAGMLMIGSLGWAVLRYIRPGEKPD